MKLLTRHAKIEILIFFCFFPFLFYIYSFPFTLEKKIVIIQQTNKENLFFTIFKPILLPKN